MATQTGKFDLNMEAVLEAWGPADAAREILANALDEQALTGRSTLEMSQKEWGAGTFGTTTVVCVTSIARNQKTTKNWPTPILSSENSVSG